MTDVTVDTRTALIEGYAGKAADITRQIITRGFATVDGMKAFVAKPKAQATLVYSKARTSATTLWVTTKAKLKTKSSPTETPKS